MTNFPRRGPGALRPTFPTRGPGAVRLLTAAIAALALLLAGCSDGSSVGGNELLEGTDGSGGTRLGETTTTVAPVTTAPPAPDPGGAAATTTAKPAPTTTAKPAAQGYPIKIQPDQAGTQFEPRVAQVFAGTPVTWTNTDSVPRSVEFADQSYMSGPIPPGGSATFTATRAGEFNYSDGTRPYAVGTLRVQAR